LEVISLESPSISSHLGHHEGIGHIQEGGTRLLIIGQMTEYIDMPGSEKDITGLGRWTTMLLKGDGVQTCIVCGYNPCMKKKTDSMNQLSTAVTLCHYAQARPHDMSTHKVQRGPATPTEYIVRGRGLHHRVP
jgi:hypothetical protein